MYDPTIGQYEVDSFQVPVYPFVETNNIILNLNDSFIQQLARRHDLCGYANYTDYFLQFPPPEQQDPTIFNASADPYCNVQNLAVEALRC